MRGTLRRAAVATVAAMAAMSSPAALVDRGGGMVYDSDLNVTFLANPNLGRGSTFDDGDSSVDGRMTLASAISWAASLDYGGFTDWRLPSVPLRDPTCSNDNTAVNYGLGCAGNELGHLFYGEFAATAGQPVSASGSPNLALFSPIADEPGSAGYWFDSPWCCSNFAFFRFAGGELSYGVDRNQNYAWAVRDGDVLAIPEPGSAALALAALLAMCRVGGHRSRPRHGKGGSSGARVDVTLTSRKDDREPRLPPYPRAPQPGRRSGTDRSTA